LRILAPIASIFVAWRWAGFLVGLGRLRFFTGPAHREARRAVLSRGAINVFLSVAAIYMWAFALTLQIAETFVGFLAATMMISLALGVAWAFMQPEVRTPETLDVCRVIRPPRR
jgi:hypothetical protein